MFQVIFREAALGCTEPSKISGSTDKFKNANRHGNTLACELACTSSVYSCVPHHPMLRSLSLAQPTCEHLVHSYVMPIPAKATLTILIRDVKMHMQMSGPSKWRDMLTNHADAPRRMRGEGRVENADSTQHHAQNTPKTQGQFG